MSNQHVVNPADMELAETKLKELCQSESFTSWPKHIQEAYLKYPAHKFYVDADGNCRRIYGVVQEKDNGYQYLVATARVGCLQDISFGVVHPNDIVQVEHYSDKSVERLKVLPDDLREAFLQPFGFNIFAKEAALIFARNKT